MATLHAAPRVAMTVAGGAWAREAVAARSAPAPPVEARVRSRHRRARADPMPPRARIRLQAPCEAVSAVAPAVAHGARIQPRAIGGHAPARTFRCPVRRRRRTRAERMRVQRLARPLGSHSAAATYFRGVETTLAGASHACGRDSPDEGRAAVALHQSSGAPTITTPNGLTLASSRRA